MGVPLDELGVTRRLPHGEVITRQGDPAASLWLVVAGAVRLSSVTPSGREIVVALLRPGDLFGEAALLGAPSPVDASAVGTTRLLALPVPALRALLERRPATAEELLRMIASRLHRTSAALEEALVGDLPTRIRGRLRELAADHGVREASGVRLRVPLTQDELARMVGSTRESVSRTVGALTGIHSKQGTVVISDPGALDYDS